MIEINNLIQTCSMCPSQWEFTTFENRHVYVRYRWGRLSIRISDQNGDIDDAITGVVIFGDQVGHHMDGLIGWEYVEKVLNKLTKNEIKNKILKCE